MTGSFRVALTAGRRESGELIGGCGRASMAVVTIGAYGALALSRRERLDALALRVVVRQAHHADASFSGGLLYGFAARLPNETELDPGLCR